jgi:hypothetical protein
MTGSEIRTPAKMLEKTYVNLIGFAQMGPAQRECVPGCEPWLFRGKRYLCPADIGAGKSLVWLVISVGVVESGGRVEILDVENGADEYARRLDAILRARDHDGSLSAACEDRLRYHEYPDLQGAWDREEWASGLANADLVIFDSSSGMLSDLELDEDSANDYSKFSGLFLRPLSQRGVTTVVLDNTGHQNTSRSRGTSAKGALNEVVWILDKGKSFDLEQEGHVFLRQTRNRFSGVAQEMRVNLGGGVYSHPFVADAPEPKRPAPGREQAESSVTTKLDPIEQAIIAALTEAGKSMRRMDLANACGGEVRKFDTALQNLKRQGRIAKGGTLWKLA